MNFTRCCLFILILYISSIFKTQGYNYDACPPTNAINLLNVNFGSLAVKCNANYDLELVTPVPKITFPHADPETLYEVLMIDPDAPSAKNPKCRSWLHMLLSNVKGSDLQNGIAADSNTPFNVITGYKPPTPPKGSGYHRYIQAAFSHAKALNLEKITERCSFDIDLFTKTNNLHPTPDANNMFKTITK